MAILTQASKGSFRLSQIQLGKISWKQGEMVEREKEMLRIEENSRFWYL